MLNANDKTHAAERRCLKCQGMFNSNGPWNRICVPCTSQNNSLVSRVDLVPMKIQGYYPPSIVEEMYSEE